MTDKASSQTQDVTIEQRGHVLLIGWNRPQKYNALTIEMYYQLAAAYGRLQRDDDLRVAVVFAHGKNFTAGLELDGWAETFSKGKMADLREGDIDPYGLAGEPLTKPVVIAVQGLCYTAGVELLLNSDVRVAATDTRFAQLEVKRGFHACGGATLRLPTEIGWANAQRYLLTGDEWSAQQALDWGLVQSLVEPGQQLDEALQIADRIAAAAPLGVKGSLRSSKLMRRTLEADAINRMYADLVPIIRSEDMQEGIASFMERRDANFKGR